MSELKPFDEFMDALVHCDTVKVILTGCGESTFETKPIHEGICALANRRTQPANEPLTIEQLREMDGDPVYVVPINQSEWICWENDGNAAYGLARKSWVRVWREETADMQHTDFDFDDYGKAWLAYRRKPETKGV